MCLDIYVCMYVCMYVLYVNNPLLTSGCLCFRPFCFCCVEDRTPQNDEGIRQALREDYNKLGKIK